jgi:hypothetical protein
MFTEIPNMEVCDKRLDDGCDQANNRFSQTLLRKRLKFADLPMRESCVWTINIKYRLICEFRKMA